MPSTADQILLVDAYLLLEQPRQRVGHWSHALAALDSPSAPPLAAVTAYYDPEHDQALLALRYDELALGAGRLAFVIEVALLAEIGMIQPAELSEGERRRFLGERLSRCTLEASGQRTAVGALGDLVRQLKASLIKPASTMMNPLPLRPPAPTAPTGTRATITRNDFPPLPRAQPQSQLATQPPPRAMVIPPVYEDAPLAAPQAFARSTRDDLPKPPVVSARSTRDDVPKHEPPPLAPVAAQTSRHVIPRASSPRLRPSFADLPPAPDSARRARSPQPDTEPYLPTAPPPGTSLSSPDTIYARYLRSGRWVPVRIGSLSLKGAALLAGALPRMQDFVDIALSFGGHRALVRGAVAKVSSLTEAAASGAATFSVDFTLDDAARRQLTALLTAARSANVTIKPPPPRATRRFPVDWPVCLGTMRGAVRADALDISCGGLFVKPGHALVPGTCLNFSAVLDDGRAPIAGRARVVRHIAEGEAKSCGLVPGYGLKILDMGDTDLARWYAFLARVEKRAERRVLVGASPARLAEIQAALSSAGYAVTGGTDPGALVQLASTDARPVDAAMIDGTWLGEGTSASWFETLFSARNVPCLTLYGDARRARASVDKILAIQ